MSGLITLIKKSKGFDGLKEHVIDKGLCCYCGSCASFCGHIEMKGDKPELITPCTLENGALLCSVNGGCYDVCPMVDVDYEELESLFLTGERYEKIGIIKNAFSAKSNKYKGQDGGIVTALLVNGIEKGLLDCAITVKRTNGMYTGEHIIAQSIEDIVSSSGTLYTTVPVVSKIGEAALAGMRKIAVVGTGCEITGIRKIQKFLLKNLPKIELTLIGLFCMESFKYPELRSLIQNILGVDIDKSERIDIKKGKFIVHMGEQKYSCKVTKLHDAVRKCCDTCIDFTARLADISVGAIGAPDGYSAVLIRSDKGEKLADILTDVKKEDIKLEEIVRITNLKEKKVEKMRAKHEKKS